MQPEDLEENARATRLMAATALTPKERKRVVEEFFTAHPGPGVGPLGLGRAVLDFQEWEVTSGRISATGGSAWWRAVNGMMVLDIADADGDSASSPSASVEAWRAYASPGTRQCDLWHAHQLSLHAAIRRCTELLPRELEVEIAFAAIVVDIVDRTALADLATDSADLAKLTGRHYPKTYPTPPGALAALDILQARTAENLRAADGGVFANVGLQSSRWS